MRGSPAGLEQRLPRPVAHPGAEILHAATAVFQVQVRDGAPAQSDDAVAGMPADDDDPDVESLALEAGLRHPLLDVDPLGGQRIDEPRDRPLVAHAADPP